MNPLDTSFECPTCCRAKFEALDALQAHLNSVTDQLLCPECKCKLRSINELVKHLDIHKEEQAKKALTQNDSESQSIKIEDALNDVKVDQNIAVFHNDLNKSIECEEYEITTAQSEYVMTDDKFVETCPENVPEEIISDQNTITDNATIDMNYVANENSNVSDEIHIENSYNCASTITRVAPVVITLSKLPSGDNLNKSAEERAKVFECSTCRLQFPYPIAHINNHHTGEEVIFRDDALAAESQTFNLPVLAPIRPAKVLAMEGVDGNGKKNTRKLIHVLKQSANAPPLIHFVDGQKSPNDNTSSVPDPEAVPPNHVVAVLKVMRCEDCKVDYTDDSYVQHMCVNLDRKRYKCMYCRQSYSFKRNFDRHMDSRHQNCFNTELSKPSAHNKNLEADPRHLNETEKENEVPLEKLGNCSKCDEPFDAFKILESHFDQTHESQEAPYKCDLCKAACVSYKPPPPPVYRGLLKNDANVSRVPHVPEPRTFFKCHICDLICDENYRDVHMQKHAQKKRCYCTICNRSFESKNNLDKHMGIHVNEKNKGIKCKYCIQTFADRPSMLQHASTAHVIDRPHKCKYCGNRFQRQYERVSHERIHTGEKPHVCHLCGKAFRVRYCLTLHLRTHTGTRPHECTKCNKRFKSQSAFKHHQLLHNVEKKFKCPYCEKTFKTSVQVTGHRNTHTKPFTCNECNRPFASLYAARVHMAIHRRENNLNFQCKVCGALYARASAVKDHIKELHPEADETQWTHLTIHTFNADEEAAGEDGADVAKQYLLDTINI